MARLCIRITPNDNLTDKVLDAQRMHEGDVVCIVDDGHQFSHAELNNGQYRIIDVPSVPQEELIYLCEQIEDAEGQMIQRRKMALDTIALKTGTLENKSQASKAEIAAITFTKSATIKAKS